MSQAQQPEQAQAQQQQEPRLPFHLTPTMLDVISAGLGSVPYNQSAPVIEDIRQQYTAHMERIQAEQAAAEQEQQEQQEQPEVEAEQAEA